MLVLVPGSHSDRYISAYNTTYGTDPGRNIAGYGYDSMMIIADAMRNAPENKSISAENIRKGLEKSQYYGVTGPKVFDSHHAAASALDRRAFKNGTFELMSISLT